MRPSGRWSLESEIWSRRSEFKFSLLSAMIVMSCEIRLVVALADYSVIRCQVAGEREEVEEVTKKLESEQMENKKVRRWSGGVCGVVYYTLTCLFP